MMNSKQSSSQSNEQGGQTFSLNKGKVQEALIELNKMITNLKGQLQQYAQKTDPALVHALANQPEKQKELLDKYMKLKKLYQTEHLPKVKNLIQH
jgi:hypothetical protein